MSTKWIGRAIRTMQSLYISSLYPPPSLVYLLYAYLYLIPSLHRQGKSRERIKTIVTSVVISTAKIYPPPKAANTKVLTAKGS